MSQLGTTYPPFGNYFASAKSFGARGGFVNGLQPTLVGRTWYVLGNTVNALGPLGMVVGSDSNNGLSPMTPLLTMSRAFALCDSYDVIVLMGVIREQLTCPLGPYDVTVIGAGNLPRQATSNGVYTGGGASWLAPTSPVALTPLVSVIEQGWSFQNIQFAPVANSDCIRFRRMETAAIPDASHGEVIGCYFSGGGAGGCGVNVGECIDILIENCDFSGLGTGTAIRNTADGGIMTPTYAHINGNRFGRGNAGDIVCALGSSLIENNVFKSLFATEAGWRINLDGGGPLGNMVINNYVADIDVTIALGFKKALAADIWRNFAATVVDPKVVVPA